MRGRPNDMHTDGILQDETIHGVPTRCAVCASKVHGTFTFFVNQHGAKVRLFCDCGVWTDRQVYCTSGYIRLCSIQKVDSHERQIWRIDFPKRG